jgi:hypothetical protein
MTIEKPCSYFFIMTNIIIGYNNFFFLKAKVEQGRHELQREKP